MLQNFRLMNFLQVSILVKIPSTETPTIQEATIMLGHLICLLVEDELFA